MYEVVRDFVDIQDDNHFYSTGDSFPRAGAKVSKARVSELASTSNRCGIVLIKVVDEDKPIEKTDKKSKKANKKEK